MFSRRLEDQKMFAGLALGCNYSGFWHFPNIPLFPKTLSLKSFGNFKDKNKNIFTFKKFTMFLREKNP